MRQKNKYIVFITKNLIILIKITLHVRNNVKITLHDRNNGENE